MRQIRPQLATILTRALRCLVFLFFIMRLEVLFILYEYFLRKFDIDKRRQ